MTIRSLGFDTVQSYIIIAAANGYVLGHSFSAPSPYAVWQVDDDSEGVCCGHYFIDREEAEWDFCARAFEWFEDKLPIEQDPVDNLREIKADIVKAAQLVGELCAEVDKLKEGYHNDDHNH